MMDLELIPHPDAPPNNVQFVTVQLFRKAAGLELLYVVEADPTQLLLPSPTKTSRADGLWQTTCFELFVHDAGQAYREFNFSPSSQWAAYSLQGYRAGMEPLAMDEPPFVKPMPEPFGFLLLSIVALDVRPHATIGLSAIIEETDGTKSYWALKHPPGAPDFHHPDCFALELPVS